MKRIFTILFLSIFYFNSLGNEIDSIKNLVKEQKTDSLKIKSYLLLNNKYIQLNTDSSLFYAQKALNLSSSKSELIKWRIISLYKIGVSYFSLGNLTKALEFSNLSINLAKENNYTKYIANNYKFIGALYGYQKEYTHALSYQYKALNIFKNTNDTENIAKTYDNISVYHRRNNNYDSSFYYVNQAINLNSKLENYKSLSFNYNNIASLHLYKNEFSKAEEFYLKSLSIREEHNLKQYLLQSYNNIGKLFHQTKEYHKSIHYFKQCIKISKEIKTIKHLPLFYKNIADSYYKLNQFKLALSSKKNQQLYSDSINNTETQIFIINAENEIQKMTNEYQNLLLKTEVENAEKLLLKKTILISILLLILIIAIYIIFQSVKRYKLQENLEKRNASLYALQGAEKLLLEKEKAIYKINNAQDSLVEEITHHLKKEVALKLKEINKQLTAYSLKEADEIKKIQTEQKRIQNAIIFINQIKATLQPKALKHSLIDSIKEFINLTFSGSDINIQFSCNQEEGFNQLDEELSKNIYRIIQELCTNILKYAKANSVTIDIKNTETHILIKVQDNGIGFDIKEYKEGLGLRNIKQRALLYKGEVSIKSKEEKGTEVTIKLKHKKI